jgi:hypothetical protein
MFYFSYSIFNSNIIISFENNNILIKIPLIYAQDDDGGNSNYEVSNDNETAM